jgi:hypothetical protein
MIASVSLKLCTASEIKARLLDKIPPINSARVMPAFNTMLITRFLLLGSVL